MWHGTNESVIYKCSLVHDNVSHMNVAWHIWVSRCTYEWVVAHSHMSWHIRHIWMWHGTYEWVTWMWHGTYEWVIWHGTYEWDIWVSRCTYEWVVAHSHMSWHIHAKAHSHTSWHIWVSPCTYAYVVAHLHISWHICLCRGIPSPNWGHTHPYFGLYTSLVEVWTGFLRVREGVWNVGICWHMLARGCVKWLSVSFVWVCHLLAYVGILMCQIFECIICWHVLACGCVKCRNVCMCQMSECVICWHVSNGGWCWHMYVSNRGLCWHMYMSNGAV